MDVKWLIALLPAVFMVHDFEEIVMFEPWLRKNRAEVRRRFPPIDRVLARYHDHLTTPAYAVAVLHEFLIIAVITYASLYFDSYGWWFGAFAVFSLHLFVHIAQWLVFGKYVPCVVTSILALPYCAYTLTRFLAETPLTTGQLAFWAGVGVVLTVLSFPPAFALAGRFERWKNNAYLRS